MDQRLILTVSEMELIKKSLDYYKTGQSNYTYEQIEKILIYLDNKIEDARD